MLWGRGCGAHDPKGDLLGRGVWVSGNINLNNPRGGARQGEIDKAKTSTLNVEWYN